MQSLIKQPAETLHESMLFGGISTISALISVAAVARGLVSGSAALAVTPTLFAGALTLAIAGGSDGERYLITAIADDADGARREAEIEVAVLDHAWVMPDGGAPMLSIIEFVDRFGIDEVVRMTDTRGDGRIGKATLVNALTDAQAQVEAYVGSRYALPLDSIPTLLKMAVGDIARGRLYAGAVPDGIDRTAKAAVAMLIRIQDGKLPITGAGSISAEQSDAPVSFISGGRTYPDGLADY